MSGVFTTLIAVMGGGGAVYLLQTLFPTRKDRQDARAKEQDERAKARDELWKELATVRSEIAILKAKVDELSRREYEHLKTIGILQVEKASLEKKLEISETEKMELKAEVTRLEELCNSLEEATGRWKLTEKILK